jgi:hypothetical protein
MPDGNADGKDRLPDNKKEEQDRFLDRAISLAPLLNLVLQILELILKILGVIK